MDHLQRFQRLTQLLRQQRQWWQFLPFEQLTLPWSGEAPRLCDWLAGHPDDELEAMRQDTQALVRSLSTFLPFATELWQLSQLPLSQSQPQVYPPRLDWQVPGRKWQQITAFAEALEERQLPWLEWCAGKGHLGRVLAAGSGQRVVSLEWQQSLCSEGAAMARRAEQPQEFVHGDALGADGEALLGAQQHAVALHACGELHLTLIRRGAARRARAISLSPCCYHLIPQEQYQPLSDAARESGLLLSKSDLKLPLQETVTAPPQVRRRRRRELCFRLGFDSLQRRQGGSGYLPLPTVPKAVLDQGFEAFCRWGAERKGVSLSLERARDSLAQGEARVSQVEQMETVRQLFRRPLEIWLALDRVLFLQQQGYRVSLGEFCPRSATPRNLLIQARLPEIT